MNQNIPYTYLIGWSHLNKWYYGRRTSTKCNPKELWVTYFTSSKYVHKFVIEHGDPDIIEVRMTFTSASRCRRCEGRVLNRIGAAGSEKWLNMRNSDGSWFGSENSFTAKHSVTGEIIQIMKDDKRVLSGEYVSVIKGMTPAVETLTGASVGLVHISDSRWLTGEICSNTKGKAAARCSITNKTIGLVDTDDPRWKTGEIQSSMIGINSGTMGAIDKTTGESIGRVSLEDNRWKTGEIYAISKGRHSGEKFAYDINGNRVGWVNCNDARWKIGELVPANKDQPPNAKDAKTGVLLGGIPKSDIRWKTGEIVGIRKTIK